MLPSHKWWVAQNLIAKSTAFLKQSCLQIALAIMKGAFVHLRHMCVLLSSTKIYVQRTAHLVPSISCPFD